MIRFQIKPWAAKRLSVAKGLGICLSTLREPLSHVVAFEPCLHVP